MANPAPTINQINAFNATQGTTIDFNIIGGTELVRSNRIYIYDLSDNSLICTHLYVSTESIHELPPNTDGSIVYESGKSSADFVNGAQYYAQIQTFTDIAGTEGGSGLSVAKMFWCLVDPTLTITTIPSTISTTSYNVSATYNANTSVVSNIIQQYQFSLYSATGSLLQSSGVVVGSGTQQGTGTIYDISYNFTGLSVGSSYYVVVDVTTTQGMSVSVQSNTFTVSIDTPTLGEATVVNNACDGYISVTSNLSSEYGGSGSGEIVSFETDSENVFTKLQVDLNPIQDLHGYDAPWVAGGGINKANIADVSGSKTNTYYVDITSEYVLTAGTTYTLSCDVTSTIQPFSISAGVGDSIAYRADIYTTNNHNNGHLSITFTPTSQQLATYNKLAIRVPRYGQAGAFTFSVSNIQLEIGSTAHSYAPYSNICPISGLDEVEVEHTGVNVWDEEYQSGYYDTTTGEYVSVAPSSNWRCTKNAIKCLPNTTYYFREPTGYTGSFGALLFYDISGNLVGTQTSTVNLFNKTFTTPSNCYQMQMYANKGNFEGVTEPFSINYPSTDHDYHAYIAEEIHKEIEATYTPTVQENEPYQFKRTGDVGGDRESIELVGGSVAWNQLVQNGNFSTESNWSASNATKSISSGICTFTASARNGNICTANPSRIFPSTPNNHKYFALAEVKLTTGTTDVVLRLNGGYKEVKTASNTNWQTLATVYNLANSDNGYVQIMDKRTSDWDSVQVKTVMLIDLTQMFGSTIADYIYTLEQGQAGAGVAFFRKYFPKPYYPYDSGTLKSVEGVSAHKMVGFNAWDEEWELGYFDGSGNPVSSTSISRSKNFIPIVPNTSYYYSKQSNKVNHTLLFYDADKNFISMTTHGSADNQFTTPSNAYFMKFAWVATTYANDICINISDTAKNGTYEPYVKNTYPLDSSITLRGIPKIANGKLYYDGDTYESDGTVTRKYGIVDLGSFTYMYAEGLFYTAIPNFAEPSDYETRKTGFLCAKYPADTQFSISSASMTDKSMLRLGGRIYIKDSSYNGGIAFKEAMSGVYLVYELATPTTETAEPFESIQKVTPNYGTEEFVTTTNVPVGNNTQYYTREIYGGTLDLVSGVLTVTHAMVDLGSLTWSGSSGIKLSTDIANVVKAPSANNIPANIVAEKYATSAVAPISANDGKIGIEATGARGRIQCGSSETPSGMLVYELATPQTYQLTPQQIQTLVGQNNVWSEQGDIELSYHIPITNLLVKRQDVGDVSGNWLTLYSQPVEQESDMDFTFIDYLNQYGKTYKYALVPLLTQTQSGVEVEVEGGYTVSDEVQSVFDGVFISDSTGSQKCKANVGYGNVDMNQVVGSITPIGAKYPIVITNSQNQYHNGSISGTIVPDDYYFNGNLSRIDMVNKRNELEQFLTNKRAKIIKDWNGNIWLAMIMDNVSCTFNNNYGMGIVNFNTNWVEVGDPTNQQDLQATGLINVGGV